MTKYGRALCFPIPFLFLAESASSASPPLITIQAAVMDARCGLANGSIDVSVSDGTPPYTYLWSNASTTEDIQDLPGGSYTLTVTDAMAQQASNTFEVVGYTGLLSIYENNPAQDSHANCPGHCWGEFRVPESYLHGTAPYLYSEPVAGYDVLGEPYFYVPGGACGGTMYQITITDNTGCSGVMDIYIVEPQIGSPPWVVSNTTGSCSGGTGGTVSFAHVFNGNFFTGPVLQVYDSNNYDVLEENFPGDNVTLQGLAPGHYHVLRNWNYSYQYTTFPCDDDTLGFDIPDLGVACGTASGTLFIDNNDNCLQDGGEVSVPEEVLEIDPGPIYTITDGSGHYSIDLVDGNYALAQNDATLIQRCPASIPVPFTISGNAQVIDLADSSTVPLDLSAWVGSTAAHPGFALTYALKVKNQSAQLSGPVTVVFMIDPSTTYTSASITPTSVVGNTITWDLTALTAYGAQYITVQCDVPAATPLGININATMTGSNTLPDADLGNNVAFTSVVVTGSFDPNEKIARTSSGWSDHMYFVDQDQYIDYTIRFQNTGTSQAVNVVVTDTLSDALDMGSFQQGVASHPFTVSFKPGRVVEWTFSNITLPDSGSDEAASHGLVGFRIRPVQPVLPGAIISNVANIYFDLNPAITTASSDLEAVVSVGIGEQAREQLQVFPNPAHDRISISASNGHLRWVDLVAADGRTVLREDGMDRSPTVDVEGLDPGIYLINAHLTNGNDLHTRFIKH